MTHPPRYRAGGLFCSGCARPLPETRRGTYCSDTCEHDSKVRSSPSYTRGKVFERDGGVCDMCELDTVAMITRLNGLVEADPELYRAECEALGIPDHRRSLWDMDHIVPVVEGGGQCGLEGYRTLCIWCHSEITASLNSKLARDRRPGPDPVREAPEILVIHLLRKPLSEPTVAENVLRWGCGGLNIDATRIESEVIERSRNTSFGGSKPQVLGGAKDDYVMSVNDKGRWPSNLILEHDPECRIEGEKTIRGSRADVRPEGDGGREDKTSWRFRPTNNTRRGYGDTETIPNWICVEGCPCRDLDGQSGRAGPSLRATRLLKNKQSVVTVVAICPTDKPGAPGYTDSGGASRFFKKIQGG